MLLCHSLDLHFDLTHPPTSCHAGGVTPVETEKQRAKQPTHILPALLAGSRQDVGARCLSTGGTLLAASGLPPDPAAAFLPLPAGGQPGVGEGEEASPAQRAAQPTAHQTHPHLLGVSGADGCGACAFDCSGTDAAVVSVSAGQCEPNQVRFIKECVKISPGLRVTGSYGPPTEERTSLSTSPSESHHKTGYWLTARWRCCCCKMKRLS